MASRFLILTFVVVGALASAQTVEFFYTESEHYRVGSDQNLERAVELASLAEAGMSLFNEIYHFDTSALPARLRVKIFSRKSDFDSYLESVVTEPRDRFVYVHYEDPLKSELVGFEREPQDLNRSFIHLGSIQLLKAFVGHTPMWLREGVAAYLENASFNRESVSFSWRPNLSLLGSLKKLYRGESGLEPLSARRLLSLSEEGAAEAVEVFYPQAWGLVHFLIESNDRRINRVLWDSIGALHPTSSLAENSTSVSDRAFSWIGIDQIAARMTEFVFDLNTFSDLIQLGVEAYEEEKLDDAESSFRAAIELEDSNFVPYYYLGLIAYSRHQYSAADIFYTIALDLSETPALIHYALGVNAFADNRYDPATEHLEQARQLNSADYGERVDALLARIEALR